MSNFPNSYDDDTTLPVVNDNLTQIGGLAINSLRDFAFNVEQYLGLGLNGSAPSLAERLGVSINPDGTLKASAIATMGLVTLPITQDQIANNAGIPESKLMLDYRTGDLFNYIRDLSKDVNSALGWISTTGVQLAPHLFGAIYRHSLDQIDVSHDLVNFPYLKNVFRTLRNNDESYVLVNDINNELLAHQWADGSPFGTIHNITTNDGSVYPSNYAHVGGGVFIDTSRFQTIPQTSQDVQSIFEFIDESGTFLLGTRIQNLYSNGISVNSRSSSLTTDGYGQAVVPPTSAIAYFLYPAGLSSGLQDDIYHGDDIIQFTPSFDGYAFDEKFAQVKVGDIVRVNYGTIEVAFRIREKKYIAGINGSPSSYYVRIAGKNIAYAPNAVARIDRPLFNNNKYGVLAVAAANNPSSVPSGLIIGSPRGAQTLGVGFNSDALDSTHYLLYLALYPSGNASDGYTILPAIDVTGNQGSTPGSYTLSSVVDAVNTAFRQPGYNYRFIAFSYQGEFGLMLADSYNNASFSILNATITPAGAYDPIGTGVSFPNNVVGNQFVTGPDPLGFGPSGSNIAGPPLMPSYGSAAASQYPTKLLVPLSRNNFYVDGVEESRLNIEVGQALDSFGDGYWVATIFSRNVISSTRVETVYNIPLDLSTSDLKVGKTLVVQSLGSGSLKDFGRFIITNINFEDGPPLSTQITVYDAVHATGVSPSAGLAPVGSKVAVYFNSDSVAFNAENASDINYVGPFKRYLEVYVDSNANTYTQERARTNIQLSGAPLYPIAGVPLYGSIPLAHLNVVGVSPKLRGYNFGIQKINLQIFAYDTTTGIYDGYLCKFDGVSATNLGPFTFGQKGTVTRFYDETNIDYVDVLFNASDSIASFSAANIDIQLFPTLSLDQEVMLLGTCQFNDLTGNVTNVEDSRQFGNISEQELSSSAISFIESPIRELHENGIIRGFDIVSQSGNTVSFSGGTALVNGKIVQVNPQTVTIPVVMEAVPIAVGGPPSITNIVNTVGWFVCVNDGGEIELIASTDFVPNGPFVSNYQPAKLNHLRLFYAMNPNALSPVPYQVRGTFFSNLVLTQRDVTPFATVGAQVTNPGGGFAVTSMLVVDARRYITNGYGGLQEPLTLGVLGSFRSLTSLNNWLVQFNEYISGTSPEANPISNTVIVKGHIDIDVPAVFNFTNNQVVFKGDGGVFDVFSHTGFELGSNVRFENITFNYYYDPTVVFDLFSFVELSGTFSVSNGSSLVTTSSSQVGILSNGSIVAFNAQPGVLYTVTSVSSGAITLNNNYTGSSNSAALGFFNGYSIPNYINSGRGLIHIPVTVFSKNIDIIDCVFNWIPSTAFQAPLFTTTTSFGINRHSFINIEMAQPTITAATLLQNVRINGNSFQDQTLNSFASFETVKAAISIVSTSTVATANLLGVGMKMIDVTIRDNICNKDQMIALVPTYSTTPGTIANSLDATNVLIENNTCGVISAFTQYNLPFDANQSFTINFFNFVADKNNGLVIRGNTCKYITASDSTGQDLAQFGTGVGATGLLVASGPIIVADNTASWIRVLLNGAGAQCVIKNNSLNAYDINFQKQFFGATSNTVNAAIELSTYGPPGTSLVNSVVNTALIDGNFINTGFYSTISPAFIQNSYAAGIYVNQHDANICNNIIANLSQAAVGIWLQTIGGSAPLLGSLHSNIHHNKFYRFTTEWDTYIFLGTAGNHLVTDNFFDQANPNGTFPANFELLVSGSATDTSTITRNVNQVVAEAFSLADNLLAVRSTNSNIEMPQATHGPAQDAVVIYSDGSSSDFRVSRYSNYFDSNNTSTGTIGSSSMFISTFESVQATAGTRTISFTIPLSNRLPPGARILLVQLGVWLQESGASAGSLLNTSTGHNVFSLTLNKYIDTASGNSSFGLLDVKNSIVPSAINPSSSVPPGTDNSTGITNGSSLLVAASPSSGTNSLGPYVAVTEGTIISATQYLSITPTVNMTTGNGYRLAVQFDANYVLDTAHTNSIVNWYFSPLVVYYTW